MAYTPNNLTSYTAAYSGAMAGLVASGRQPESEDSNTWVGNSLIAGAFAQSFDTQWGSVAPDTLEVFLIESGCFGVFEDRNTTVNNESLDPDTWNALVKGLIAAILQGEAYVLSQGITPNPWPSGSAPGNTDFVKAVSFTFTSSSPIVVGGIGAGSIMNRVDILIATPFNDAAATIEFGLLSGAANAFFDTTDAQLDTAGQYERQSLETVVGSDIMILTLNPGASTQGSGLLLFKLLPG